MKRLILMRHAKSSWVNADQRDIDRPLNRRGVKSSKLLGKWLVRHDYRPDLGIVSAAQRTRETWDGLRTELGKVPVTYSPDLYHCTADIIMQSLLRADGDVVLLLAHQPGIGDFAQRSLATLPDIGEFHRYPTAATSIMDFEISSWSKLTWGSGTLTDFIYPRALTGRD